jgi:hypothetical protein
VPSAVIHADHNAWHGYFTGPVSDRLCQRACCRGVGWHACCPHSQILTLTQATIVCCGKGTDTCCSTTAPHCVSLVPSSLLHLLLLRLQPDWSGIYRVLVYKSFKDTSGSLPGCPIPSGNRQSCYATVLCSQFARLSAEVRQKPSERVTCTSRLCVHTSRCLAPT